MQIGKKIKTLRQILGVSQNKLAKISGVKQCQISKIEGGGDCKFQTACKILNGLGYQFSISLLDRDEEGGHVSKLELVLLTFSTLYLGGHFVYLLMTI